LAKLKHDIIRHYLPAGDLKMLITIFQESNYDLLTDSLTAARLLTEKAIIDVAEGFVNADSSDGEYQYDLVPFDTSDYSIIDQQLFLNSVSSEFWTGGIKAIIDISMHQRISVASEGAYLTFPPTSIYVSPDTGEIEFTFQEHGVLNFSLSDRELRNLH
jgi:hypothetical protein